MIYVAYTLERPLSCLACTLKVNNSYFIFIWGEIKKRDPLLADILLFHELIHVALAEKYSKTQLIPTHYIPEIHQDLQNLLNRILAKRDIIRDLINEIKDEVIKNALWEIWGMLFSYFKNDEELLAHIYTLLRYFRSKELREEYEELKRIMQKINLIQKIEELRKKIKVIG